MKRWIFTVLCLLMTLVPVAVSAQASQDDDRGYIQGLLEDSLSGEGRTIRMQGFAGALSSQATIEALTIADKDGVWLTLENVVMSWRRAALLRGRVEIEELSAEKISMPRLPAPTGPGVEDTEAKPFSLPELPVSVNIGKIEADLVEIGAPVVGQAAQFSFAGSLRLDGGEGDVDMRIERLDQKGDFVIQGGFDNGSRVLTADVDLDEGEGGLIGHLAKLPGNPALRLTIKGEAPISDFEADISLATDGQERVSGAFRLTEVPATTEAAQAARLIGLDLRGDVTQLVPAEYHAFFGTDSTVSAEVIIHEGGETEVRELSLTAAEFELRGDVTLAASGLPTQFDVSGSVSDGSRLQIPVSGGATWIRKADFSAQYDETQGDRWSLMMRVDGLEQESLSVDALTLDGTGRIRAQEPRSVTADLSFDVSGFEHSDPAIVRAAGTALNGRAQVEWAQGQAVRVSQLTADGAGISMVLRGAFGSVADGLPFDGALQLAATDISRFSDLAGQPLQGGVDVEVEGHTELLSQIFDLQLAGTLNDVETGQPRLDPLLRGTGKITLNVRRDEDGMLVSPLQIETPAMRAELRGGLNSKVGQGIVTADLTDLALVEPRVSGAGTLRARADWNRGEEIRVHGLQLTLGETQFEGQGRFWPEAETQPFEGNLRLITPDLSSLSRLAGRPLRGSVDLAMNTKGTLADQSFDIRGSLTGASLQAGLPDLDKLLQGNVWLRFDLGRKGDQIDIRSLEIDTPQLDANASGVWGNNQPLTLSARLSDLGLFVSDFRGPVTASGTVRATTLAAETVSVALDLTGPGGVAANLNGAIRQGGQQLDLGITGSGPLGLANQFILPRSIQGVAQFDLALRGTPGLDALSGTVSTNGARLSLPQLQQAIDNISGTATFNTGRVIIDLTGQPRTGGQLRVSGPLALTPPLQADLGVRLDGVVLEDPSLYRTSVNGDLRISGPLQTGGQISGTLELPKTEIQVPSTGISSLGAIPDINHRNEPAAVRASRQRAGLIPDKTEAEKPESGGLGLDLRINAPNEIFVRGRGLDAELGGSLRLQGTTNNVIPSGQFELARGRLDILAKRLELNEGLITLQGDFDPYLRFVAERVVDDTTLQIVIEGLASDPEVTFTSQPNMPQEEVVSRLLFGQGLDKLSAFQAVRLAAAVATLAGNGNAGLMSSLRESTGLADLDVNTDEDGNAQVSAGFYISDKLYSEVAVDQTGESEVQINLDLSKSIKVKGIVQSRGDTGIGIYFEKDY